MRIFFATLLLASAAEAAVAPMEAKPADQTAASTPSEELLRIRDPFKRPEIETSQATPRSDLERYQVDSFKMVAVLTGPTRIRAMLLAPDGKTYMVNERMKIGTRNGVIRV